MGVFICVTIVEMIMNKFRLCFAFCINYLLRVRGDLFQLKGNCGGRLRQAVPCKTQTSALLGLTVYLKEE